MMHVRYSTTCSRRSGENMPLLFGKVPMRVLKKIVYKHLGARRSDVILGPSIGEDAAILRAGNEILVLKSDPVTGALERVGFLAVHVNANDVATRGVEPSWLVSTILLPENFDERAIKTICSQMDKAASSLGIAIVGGHTEVTPGLDHAIVIGATAGVAKDGRYVRSDGARPSDKLIMTKGAGVEGTAILASDRRTFLEERVGGRTVARARRFYERISVVRDALIAFRTGGVHAMHDPTEGGIAGGLHEIADASGVGFTVDDSEISVAEETRMICGAFDIDPLQLVGSGALLIACEASMADQIVNRLAEEKIEAAIIGEVLAERGNRFIVRRDGKRAKLPVPKSDHLWRALGFQG